MKYNRCDKGAYYCLKYPWSYNIIMVWLMIENTESIVVAQLYRLLPIAQMQVDYIMADADTQKELEKSLLIVLIFLVILVPDEELL